MDQNPYVVFGRADVPCLGRKAELAKFSRLIPKNHLSIVGPRYMGKTALARELCSIFSKPIGGITSSIYWDLGTRTAGDDAEFYAQFAQVLSRGLEAVDRDSAEKLKHAEQQHYDEVRDVFEYLDELNICVLVCMDSFDHLLGRGVLTQNLWDNLGALADRYKSIRYLAISRRTLNELCWVPGSETSHFWKLFDTTPHYLRCLTEEDVDAAVQPFRERNLTVGKGFVGEIWNWSGGVPPLVAGLCRNVWDGASEGDVLTNETVNAAARRLQHDGDTLLPEVWRSFSAEQQRLLAELGVTGKQIELPKAAKPLVESHIVVQQGKLQSIRSGLLRSYAASEHGQAGGSLKEFFESKEAYCRNMRTVLDFRLGQLVGVDKTIMTHLTDMVEKLDEPDIVISKPRLIANRAFELIWNREFNGFEIPGEWIREFGKFEDRPRSPRIPTELGPQCRILDLMTQQNCTLPCRISRFTYHLLEGLPAVGNTGAHLRGPRQSLEYSIAVTMWCLQLADQLTTEIAS